jgi:tRNA threonylcarbamoyladenosine biosynthesis protein TsaB
MSARDRRHESPRLLAVETATEACSAALYLAGEVRERFLVAPREHADRILSMVSELLSETALALQDLDAIAFGRGPGSFTGVRIAASVTQGLALGVRLPVVPVSSLAALAQDLPAHRVLAALDARMGEVYWCAYERDADGLMRAVGPEMACTPDRVPAPPGSGWIGAGSGWRRYGNVLQQHLGSAVVHWIEDCYPRACAVARLAAAALVRGEAVAPEDALPVYLRDDVTQAQPR